MGFGLGPPAHAEHEIAEGFRYAGDVMRIALDLHLETAPRFIPLVTPTLKLLGDNPDAMYYISALDGDVDGEGARTDSYMITGCR